MESLSVCNSNAALLTLNVLMPHTQSFAIRCFYCLVQIFYSEMIWMFVKNNSATSVFFTDRLSMGDVALLKEGERLTKTAVTASIGVMDLLRPTKLLRLCCGRTSKRVYWFQRSARLRSEICRRRRKLSLFGSVVASAPLPRPRKYCQQCSPSIFVELAIL